MIRRDDVPFEYEPYAECPACGIRLNRHEIGDDKFVLCAGLKEVYEYE